MLRHVDLRDRERILRDIDRIDLRIRKHVAGKNRKTPRAGAEIEHAGHRHAVDELLLAHEQLAIEKLGEIRARHDRALVDVERVILQIGALDQIGGWGCACAPASRSGRTRAGARLR